MAGSYAWINLSTAISQLGQRLNITPSSSSFWTTSELTIYIQQALRIFNSLTWQWRADFQYNDPVNLWNSLGLLAGSPRLRTITDTYCYTEMEAMLLEPQTGSVWTGTSQFNISVLSQALQRRRDEIIQISNCNQSLLSGIALTPNTTRTYLPDTVIDVERVRYLPTLASPTGTAPSGASVIAVSSTYGIQKDQLIYGTGVATGTTVTGVGSNSVQISIPTSGAVSGTLTFTIPTTLYRDDQVANEFYEAPLYQQAPGTPQTFSLSSEPPLSWDVDVPPDQPGTYEAVVLQSGAPFNPPTSTLVGIPNDWTYILEFGALADLLRQEAESTDNERADYCMKKYQEGLEWIQRTPWIGLAKVNGVAVSIDSIYAMDQYSVNWDSNPTSFGPVIVAGGVDNIAAPVGQGIGCTVLANAPILDSTNTYVQISRPMADTMFDLAQARACFKMGGGEWKAALELEQRALLACEAERVRLMSQGAFSDFFDERGRQQERDRNRYNAAHKK